MNQNEKAVSFIPLGGIGDVTKNMYLYEYDNQILIVDCGIGFADETMLGVDLLIPDISYLLKTNKKIVGMVITHGHEDHMGALPFILPQLKDRYPSFPILATPLTAALCNEKLTEFGVSQRVQKVEFDEAEKTLGDFKISFIRVTHSIPDTAHVFIKTPAGNFYHGSDFKFDESPQDGKKSDYEKIRKIGLLGISCLMSDCLGAENLGRTLPETSLLSYFEEIARGCMGKFIVTTYSSHIGRINQVIQVSQKVGRKVCFIGRSLIKTKEVAENLGYLKLNSNMEIQPFQIRNYPSNKVTLIVAGSQGQENSGLSRIVSGDLKEIILTEDDTVVFSADPIPGNEFAVYELIDTIAKKGVKVLYADINPHLHVSGHGNRDELSELVKLLKPQKLLPISGRFRHMSAYRSLVQTLGYQRKDILLIEDGQQVIFSKHDTKFGKIVPTRNVYVDEVSKEEIEGFVLRDRQKLSEGGIVIVLAQIDSVSGQLVGKLDIITRGFPQDGSRLKMNLVQNLKVTLSRKKGRVTNWVYLRRFIGETTERLIFKQFHRRPLVLPLLLEV